MIKAASVVFALLLASAGPAAASMLRCDLTINLHVVAHAETPLPSEKHASTFLQSEAFELKITGLESDLFELEVFDRIAPTRGYARARLAKAGDRIGYSFWERDRLLEVDCAY